MTDETTDVLIVGGSMVGLAQALFLAEQGIRPILVERHSEVSAHPRAQVANRRTMEIMRALGLEEAIRARETPHAQYGEILQVDSLVGSELGWFEGLFRNDPDDVAVTGSTLIGQDRLEPILLERARELGAEIRFSTELVSHEQDAEGVTAVLRNLKDGSQHAVRAQYVVAADGSRAQIRKELGIGAHGQGVFGRQMSVIFRANLDPYVAGRKFFLCFVNNPAIKGVLGRAGSSESHRWVLAPSLMPEESHEEYSTDECVALVRAAVGVPDLAVEVESSTSWEIAASVADRFRSGRVLLAGDCAHVMPPTGGFGGNMGVQDAHNLAWKLALVLRGQAGPELLESYETERVPIAEFTVEQGIIRYLQRNGLDQDRASHHQPETTVLFGHLYRSNAVLAEPGPDSLAPVEDPALPSGRPGTRAPHLMLCPEGQVVALHDLMRGGFWLLAGPDGGAWKRAADIVRIDTGLPLSFHLVGSAESSKTVEKFTTQYGIGASGAALIRPDGFIAWRTAILPDDAVEVLTSVFDRLLSRTHD
ncbi:FAD-dependent monooxygenase [Streptomyces sp. CT34]|uniref:FAD-dependent monooxygenase n=1 Tax=Streptomyces sp. CT34 TaxID=1553907 RepID=UPI0005B9ABD1|nr:FAD-dependent monooxygenase [Streptomyces sp. CT34]